MNAPYGIVAFDVSTPFGAAQRVGAMLADGTIIDLRNAYRGYLEHFEKDPAAAEIASARVPDSTVGLVKGGAPSRAAVTKALDFARASGAAATVGGEPVRIAFTRAEVRLRPAIEPGKMVCTGRNYRAHQTEMNMATFEDFPRGFIKVNSTLLADGADLAYPEATEELDFEVELAIVIGSRTHDVAPASAYDHVWGYTIFNDLSARDWQSNESRHGNHVLGKNLDGLAPLGPAIVPKEFVPDPMNLRLTLRVNGEVRQDASTAGMIFDIPTLMAHWSKMTLEPGDLVATGTPEGTAAGTKPRDKAVFLRRGDRVEAEVEGLGVLRTNIV